MSSYVYRLWFQETTYSGRLELDAYRVVYGGEGEYALVREHAEHIRLEHGWHATRVDRLAPGGEWERDVRWPVAPRVTLGSPARPPAALETWPT